MYLLQLQETSFYKLQAMKLFGYNITKDEKRSTLADYNEAFWTNSLAGTINYNSLSNYQESKALKLSTVFRCINLISDSIASLPCLPYYYKENWKYVDYENNIYNLLNIAPNNLMGAFTFKKMLIINMLLKGNSYVYVKRRKDLSIESLSLLNSDLIEVIIENGQKKYRVLGTDTIYQDGDIIHILNYTSTGLLGVSTLNYAANALGIAYDSETHAANFFRGGGNLNGILKPVAGVNLRPDKALKAKQDFISALSTDTTIGGTSGGIVVLDSGLEFQTISVNPKDAQLLESRQFSVIDICRFFNVPPSMAFDQNGKYATSEQQGLDFLNNCLMPIIEKLENELFRKLYDSIEWDANDLKFDVENLLRADATSRADYYVKLHSVGGYTSNEIRERLNAPFPLRGGNRGFVQTNLQPIDNLIVEKETNNVVDNKLK